MHRDHVDARWSGGVGQGGVVIQARPARASSPATAAVYPQPFPGTTLEGRDDPSSPWQRQQPGRRSSLSAAISQWPLQA